MAPRPNWKGFLKLSLGSCSVALYPATATSQRVRFNIINRETGHRIRNEVVDAETGEPVAPEDRVKGYEVEKGQYILRDEKNYFDDIPNIKVPADKLKLATHILETKKAKFDPLKFEDRYETALLD